QIIIDQAKAKGIDTTGWQRDKKTVDATLNQEQRKVAEVMKENRVSDEMMRKAADGFMKLALTKDKGKRFSRQVSLQLQQHQYIIIFDMDQSCEMDWLQL
ncbi:hypothetical protein K469DRAFT_550763, partial [Zopfia rhizophila CBS 207.26]